MLKQANCIKRITATGGGSLRADAGESLLIRRIECVPSANDTYLSLFVDRVACGYYRLKGQSGNHLTTLVFGQLKNNLMEFLTSKGINVTIPVAEGQEFAVVRYAQAGNVIIIYDIYDAGDIKETMENGSKSSKLTWLNYLNVGTALVASGDALLNVSLTPSAFIDFPAGVVVPSLFNIEVLGLVGSPFVSGAAGPVSFATKFIKMISNREILFDEDRNGIPFNGENPSATYLMYKSNFSLVGPCTEIVLDSGLVTQGQPLLFTPPLAFSAGAELAIYLTMVKTGAATWLSTGPDLAVILRSTRIG